MVRLSWSPIIVCWMPDAGPMPAAPPRWRESWLMVRNTSEWIFEPGCNPSPACLSIWMAWIIMFMLSA